MSGFIEETAISLLTMLPVFLLPALGEMLGEKSGVYNIGIDGVMAFGALSGVAGYMLMYQSHLAAMMFGFAGGIAFGLFNSLLSIRFKLNQIIVGFGIWFFATGLAGLVYTSTAVKDVVAERFTPIFFSFDAVFYLSIVIFIGFYVLFAYTKQGTIIRAVGMNPRAADAAGINVDRVRWTCATLGAGLVGFGGAYFAINFFQGFTQVAVAGYGWIAFAIVIFGRWRPSNVLLGSLLFATITGLQTRGQVIGIAVPSEFMNVLPHISVIIALTLIMVLGGRQSAPESLGNPYVRE